MCYIEDENAAKLSKEGPRRQELLQLALEAVKTNQRLPKEAVQKYIADFPNDKFDWWTTGVRLNGLQILILTRSEELVKYAIDKGAIPDATNISLAIKLNHESILNLLCPNFKNPTETILQSWKEKARADFHPHLIVILNRYFSDMFIAFPPRDTAYLQKLVNDAYYYRQESNRQPPQLTGDQFHLNEIVKSQLLVDGYVTYSKEILMHLLYLIQTYASVFKVLRNATVSRYICNAIDRQAHVFSIKSTFTEKSKNGIPIVQASKI